MNGGDDVEPPGKNKLSYIQYEIAPKLKRPVFDPSSLNCDKLAIKNFLIQYGNCVLDMHNMALIKKKTCQGSCLEGSHLSTSMESFDTAMEIISCEYSDERYLVEQIFVAIDIARPVREKDVSSIKDFFAEIESLLYELKNSFSLEFLEEGTSGNRYFIPLITHKLPMFWRK